MQWPAVGRPAWCLILSEKKVSTRSSIPGTDTAGAIRRVRVLDLPKTRGERTFIMIFTDGQSDLNQVKEQSKLLHPLVDEVYAFGIGEGVYVPELEAIASEPENWKEMKDFNEYREYVKLFMLGLTEGCSASVIQPYRIIDLRTPNYISYGVSDSTADLWNVENPSLNCGGNCVSLPEHTRDIQCAECSEKIAAVDLEAMEVFKENITEAAYAKCFNAALLVSFQDKLRVEHFFREPMAGYLAPTQLMEIALESCI